MDGWTVVHRRRRPERIPDGGRVRDFRGGSRPPWGTDRAFTPPGTFSSRGGPPYLPNLLPVPPRVSDRSGFPQPLLRTKVHPEPGAQRTGYQRGPNLPREKIREKIKEKKRGNTNEYIKPNQRFKKIVHVLHGLIRTVHHGDNIRDTEKNKPKMINNMVKILSNMIKPALPTQKTRDNIIENAQCWGDTTMGILKQHYEEKMEEFLREVEGFHKDEWEEPFDIAIKWSLKKLPRLQEVTIKRTREIIRVTVADSPLSPQTDPPNPQPDPPNPLADPPPNPYPRPDPTVDQDFIPGELVPPPSPQMDLDPPPTPPTDPEPTLDPNLVQSIIPQGPEPLEAWGTSVPGSPEEWPTLGPQPARAGHLQDQTVQKTLTDPPMEQLRRSKRLAADTAKPTEVNPEELAWYNHLVSQRPIKIDPADVPKFERVVQHVLATRRKEARQKQSGTQT